MGNLKITEKTMPRNQLSKNEIKCFVLKLKDELYKERYSEGMTFIAHKYLDKILSKIEEYRY